MDPAPAPDVLSDVAAATLDADQLAELGAFGTEHTMAEGQVLFRAGEDDPGFFVVLDGEVDIVRHDRETDVVIVTHGPGRFLGELSLLTGQRALLSARAATAGRVLEIAPADFRRLMTSRPTLADIIFRTLEARREVLMAGDGAQAVRIIGSRFSPEAMALRSFAMHSHLIHTWVDLEDVEDQEVYLAGLGLRPRDIPVVITPTGLLRRPTTGAFAEELGLTFHSPPGFLFDLVVIGTGPAGLAASVYGASEGLNTVSLDAVAIGGQAGASSRIENYAGFPNGISGDELVNRTAIQAQRLGARLNSPCEVTGLRSDLGTIVLQLADGSEIATRATIIASGARYRRLAVEDLERFEGAGVYYAATDLEVRACNGQEVVVVGGGNSAGQAAIYLAQQGSRVSIVIRRDDLYATMSDYLIQRIDADPRIELLGRTEVRELAGDTHLQAVTLEHTPTGARRSFGCAGVFCFIGAEPATAWLDGAVALDAKGFVLTDRALPEGVESGFGREPLPFETSLPGVFAAGDVRHGSLKRVAAAVGEGSSAVRSVHDHLATVGR